MRVVDQTVHDGVGEGAVSDDIVPELEGELAGYEGGLPPVTVLEELQEISPLGVGERGEAEVIEDEQLRAGDPGLAGEAELVKSLQGLVDRRSTPPELVRA